jgi:hypothetical protein
MYPDQFLMLNSGGIKKNQKPMLFDKLLPELRSTHEYHKKNKQKMSKPIS